MMNCSPQRRFEALRVSLTSRCNLACSYCVDPNQAPAALPHELSAAQLAQAVRLLDGALSLKKIRLTGGEPLLGNKLKEFLPLIEDVQAELCLTTNGQLLEENLDWLGNTPLRKINVSLDSLQEETFSRLTRGGKLERTLAGIRAAQAGGFVVRINMIPLRGVNEQELLAMLEFALETGVELRYLELMKMGHVARHGEFERQFVGMPEILQQLRTRYRIEPLSKSWGDTALRFEVVGYGKFGIIANETAPFCADCNRLRLSAQGEIYGCLSSIQKQDVKPLLALPATEAVIQVQNLLGEAMSAKQALVFTGSALAMKGIGG